MDPLLGLGVAFAAGLAIGVAAGATARRRRVAPTGSAAAAATPPSAGAHLPSAGTHLPSAGAHLPSAGAGRLEAALKAATEREAEARARLAELAGLDATEARTRALEELDRELAEERGRRIEASVREARETAEVRAREIVVTALQRVAANHASERSVTSVPLPDDSWKGRVIGRDGRNAAAFERATGCDVVVDETPGLVTISGFDPVRREVARRAMSALVADGRIAPARIEEVVTQARAELEVEIVEAGRQALLECDAGDAHPRVLELLGRLRYRTSYGQNVLRHAVEVSHLCGAMAGEMGLDPRIARRAGLLHDLGKAVDQEAEGGHAAIGGDVARRCGETPAIVNAIASHHEEVPQETPYAVLAQVADAISASRPGARTDSAETFVRRLRALEAVAASFAGVREAYAVQAGREVRVLVDAAQVSDAAAPALAREIAKAVEAELAYPGEVKVTVLRETQAISYAR